VVLILNETLDISLSHDVERTISWSFVEVSPTCRYSQKKHESFIYIY